MLLAQLSDLHLTVERRQVCGRIDTAPFLERAVARLAAFAPRIDALVVTGDLVDRGERAEYARLRALLAPLRMPVHLLLGNHDHRAAFRAEFADAPYLRAPTSDAVHVQYAFELGPATVIALDTHDPDHPRGGGRLCDARRRWLAERLREAAGRPVVIAMHHPPFETGVACMDTAGLDRDDVAAFATLVRQHPNIERVICGHFHRPIHARFAGTLASTAPSCAHQIHLDFDAGAPGAYTFEPPAFALHRWGRDGLVSHLVAIDAFDGPHRF